jgi:hypothetical protein
LSKVAGGRSQIAGPEQRPTQGAMFPGRARHGRSLDRPWQPQGRGMGRALLVQDTIGAEPLLGLVQQQLGTFLILVPR